MKFKCKYEYTNDLRYPKHVYTCIGAKGAVHFHLTDMGENYEYGEKYSCGLEFHHRQPPEYMKDDCPSHNKCWLLNQPCWHDGTSLYAQEGVLPFWKLYKDRPDEMFLILQHEYKKHFKIDED